jgi:hypothetical protein
VKYLARHKWFVFVAGLKTGVPLWRLIRHDWSKLLPSEWFPYADFFYVQDPTTKERRYQAFREAWRKHIHRNDHHWEYWVSVEQLEQRVTLTANPMPLVAVREMVADWAGAGRAITGVGNPTEWFITNRPKMALHTNTEIMVHQILRECYGADNLPIIRVTSRRTTPRSVNNVFIAKAS